MITGDDIKRNISKNIVKYREKSGLSQKELAQQLNTTPSRISNWEQGSNCPTIDILFEVCKVLNVSINDIYGVYPDSQISLSYDEQEYIKKYRSLDSYGQETVSLILDRETARVASLQEKDTCIAELEATLHNTNTTLRIYTYMRKIAAAGTGFYFDDIPTDTIEAPFLENADFIIGVSGDSMEPTYSDGDLVYVEKCQTIETGTIGIFILNKECFIKEAGEDGLISHNRKYDKIPGSSDIICVGKVLGKVNLG